MALNDAWCCAMVPGIDWERGAVVASKAAPSHSIVTDLIYTIGGK